MKRDLTLKLRRHGWTLGAFAERIGKSRDAVKKWRKVPAELVPEIETATGIPRHELRPDLYPSN